VLPVPLPPSRCVTRWVRPLTPLAGPNAERNTEAPAGQARGRAETSYNWLRLMDLHKLIRQSKGSNGTTLPSHTV
jgi:hypothetical protein